MKLGMVTYNVAQDWDLPMLIEMCEKTGFTGVELRTTHPHGVEISLTPAERLAVRERFAETPVVLWCLGSTCEYHSADPQVVRDNIEETKEWVKLAADVGAVGVKVRPNGLVEGVPEEVTLRQIGDALRECGEFAQPYGIKIMVEVHGPQTSEPRRMKTILEHCGHPCVGATWNCNNGIDVVAGSIRDNFALLAPWIWSVHIHDLYEAYPYHELIALLQTIGFDGFCLIEMPESCEPERLLKYYSLLWGEWTK